MYKRLKEILVEGLSGASRAYKNHMRGAEKIKKINSPKKLQKWFKHSNAARQALWAIPTSKDRDAVRSRVKGHLKRTDRDIDRDQ